MDHQPADVHHTHGVQLLSAAGTFPVVADLEYRRADPYAVTATFTIGTRAGVRWLFARDLLIAGMAHPAGVGDIRIAPLRSDAGTITVELRSPNGHALLTIPAAPLTEFLAATYAVVPVGTEHLVVDLDDELTAVLAD